MPYTPETLPKTSGTVHTLDSSPTSSLHSVENKIHTRIPMYASVIVISRRPRDATPRHATPRDRTCDCFAEIIVNRNLFPNSKGKMSRLFRVAIKSLESRCFSLWTVSLKIRYAHTDLPQVNFQEHRRKSLEDPNVSSTRTVDQRRVQTYAMSFGTSPHRYKASNQHRCNETKITTRLFTYSGQCCWNVHIQVSYVTLSAIFGTVS